MKLVVVIICLLKAAAAAQGGTTIQDLGDGITIVKPDSGPTITCIDMGGGVIKCK